jgi:hypothetical protein
MKTLTKRGNVAENRGGKGKIYLSINIGPLYRVFHDFRAELLEVIS